MGGVLLFSGRVQGREGKLPVCPRGGATGCGRAGTDSVAFAPRPCRLTSCWVVAACRAVSTSCRERGLLSHCARAYDAGVIAAELVPAGPAHRPERPHTTRDREKENITAVAAQPSCTIRGSPCRQSSGGERAEQGSRCCKGWLLCSIHATVKFMPTFTSMH